MSKISSKNNLGKERRVAYFFNFLYEIFNFRNKSFREREREGAKKKDFLFFK
jgi:hypothetical protein